MSAVKRRQSPEKPPFVLYGTTGKASSKRPSESEYRKRIHALYEEYQDKKIELNEFAKKQEAEEKKMLIEMG